MLELVKTRYTSWRSERRKMRFSRINQGNGDGVPTEFDLVFLYRKGFVRTGACGESITRIHGLVENLLDIPVRLAIRPGTCFLARGNFQNMAVRKEYKMRVPPAGIAQVELEAVCVEAEKPGPGGADSFLGVHTVSADLEKFLTATRFVDAMTVQAGVWAITDCYCADQIKSRMLAVGTKDKAYRAITDREIQYARQLLDGLGIQHIL